MDVSSCDSHVVSQAVFASKLDPGGVGQLCCTDFTVTLTRLLSGRGFLFSDQEENVVSYLLRGRVHAQQVASSSQG